MLDFSKTDLIENTLVIINDDGSITCIPREGAIESELALFAEFEEVFPNGKPQQPIEPSEPMPTEIEVVQQQLFETQTALLQTQSENSDLGSQLFDLQTQLMMKGVI